MNDDYREFEAKSVDEAIILAMKTFNAAFEDLDIKVLSEGSKGLFGLVGTKTAKVLAKRAGARDAHPAERSASAGTVPVPQEQEPGPPPEQVPDQETLMEARKVVSEILTLMSMPGEVKVREENILEIVGDGSGLVIGKRGQTLDSLQFIVNRIVNKSKEVPSYVTLDTEGYRQRHVGYLRSLALKMGQKAKRTGQSISLEKMNPYDRRIIHLTLKNESGVNTKSIGEGVYKKVLIVPRKALK
jgi:spoIIIJ-associated protein